jgi:hypothetical protein
VAQAEHEVSAFKPSLKSEAPQLVQPDVSLGEAAAHVLERKEPAPHVVVQALQAANVSTDLKVLARQFLQVRSDVAVQAASRVEPAAQVVVQAEHVVAWSVVVLNSVPEHGLHTATSELSEATHAVEVNSPGPHVLQAVQLASRPVPDLYSSAPQAVQTRSAVAPHAADSYSPPGQVVEQATQPEPLK